MKTFSVYISETYSGYVSIEADNPEQAEELVRDKLVNGDINPMEEFDGDTIIDVEEVSNG
jgi:hypothetical protein